MLKYIDSETMGREENSWLSRYMHFSFANYYDGAHIHFGVLRVLNDNTVQPGAGFDTHPHDDMEVLSYVVNGTLSHADSMGNKTTLTRGQAQYISAGTGLLHSEYNWEDVPLRFLQIWFYPDKQDYQPRYQMHPFLWEERINQWLPLATGENNVLDAAPIRIHTDVNVFASMIEPGKQQAFTVGRGKQAYIVCMEGETRVRDIVLHEHDALKVVDENISFETTEGAHLLAIEMPIA